MPHGRPTAISAHKVDLGKLPANGSQRDDPQGEERLQTQKGLRRQPKKGTDLNCSSSSNNGHSKRKTSPRAAITTKVSSTSPHNGTMRGNVVSWANDVQEAEGHSDNTRNSPNDQPNCSARSLTSRCPTCSVFSTDDSRCGTANTIPLEMSDAAAVAEQLTMEGEEKDDTNAASNLNGVAGCDPFAKEAVVAKNDVGCQHLTKTKAPTELTCLATVESSLRSLDSLSPQPNMRVLEGECSTQSAGMHSASRYSSRSSSCDTLDGTLASDPSAAQKHQYHQHQKQSEQPVPLSLQSLRQDGLSFPTLPDSSHTIDDSCGAPGTRLCAAPSSAMESESSIALDSTIEDSRFSVQLCNDLSLRPPQLETLPPPRELSLRAAQMPPWHRCPSSMSTSEALVDEHHTPHHPQRQHQQSEEQPYMIGQMLQQAHNPCPSGLQVSELMVQHALAPEHCASPFEYVLSPPMSPSFGTTNTTTTTPTNTRTSENFASVSGAVFMSSSTLSCGHSFRFPPGGEEETAQSVATAPRPHAPESPSPSDPAASARQHVHDNGVSTAVPWSPLRGGATSVPVAGTSLLTPPMCPVTHRNDGDSTAPPPASNDGEALHKVPSINRIFRSSRGAPMQKESSFAWQSPPVRSLTGRQVSLVLGPDIEAKTPHRPLTKWRESSHERGSRLPSPSCTTAPPSALHSCSSNISQGTLLAAHSESSPRSAERSNRRGRRSTDMASSYNTLISIDMIRTTSSTSTTVGDTAGAATSGEFDMWTRIVSWSKDEHGHPSACERDRSRAAAITALTGTTIPSPLSFPSQSDGRYSTRLSNAQSDEIASFPQDSVLGSSRVSTSTPEITRARQTALLRHVRHARIGDRYLNNYRILKTLGKGTCGKVKLAYDEDEKRYVAIKFVRRADTRKRIGGLTMAQQQYNSVVREIQVMKKLRHRNIVSLYEVIDDPSADKLYLVMQYVDKGVVAKVEVRANSDYVCDPIPPAQLVRYAREILTGLQYLHRHDVVHRDLKPDNILVNKEGHVFLADFGVAETFDTSYRQRMKALMAQSMARSMAMSVTGNRAGGPQVLGTKGTPLFIAPELWSGTKSYGKPVDMWAMGVTLFTLLVGKLPFRSPEDITDAQFKPTVPEAFDEKWRVLLEGLLDRNPQARWTVKAALKHVTEMFAEKEAFEDRAYVHVSKALGANATTTSRVASAPSTPSAVSIAVPKVDSNAINATNVLYVPEVVRRPSGGSSAAATKPSPPAPALYPRALCQETSGSPLETDTLTHVASCNLVSANLTECGNNTNPKARAPLSTLPVTSLHLSRRGSAARLRELKELTPMPVPLTLVPVSPDCPLALQQQGSNVSSGKSVEPLDVPSSEGSASSLTSALAPMTREGTEERKSAKARSQQPSTGPSAPTYRTFAVHWPPSPLAGVQPVAKAKQLQTQPFMENVHCRSPSVEPMRVTSPLMPLSATPTALNSARTSRTSSRMSHVAAADEAALGSTSAMRRAVLPPRLLSPSLPLPFSRRSSRDDTSATPVGACTATASPFLTVNYRSPSFSAHPKDERGSSLARPVVPLQVASVAASQEMSSGGGNSGLALTPSLNLRGAGSNLQLDLRERSPTLTPTEGAAVKTGRDAWPCTRSAAALPGITITTASRPISPLYTTGAPALLSPSALQPIKATPQQSPLHFLAPHPQRNRSKSSAFSSKEESSASFTKLLCDDAHE